MINELDKLWSDPNGVFAIFKMDIDGIIALQCADDGDAGEGWCGLTVNLSAESCNRV